MDNNGFGGGNATTTTTTTTLAKPMSRSNAFFHTSIHAGGASGEFEKEESSSGPFTRIRKTKPIADLFPNTTVLFGKLVQCTHSWWR